jgi:hypothetical protein
LGDLTVGTGRRLAGSGGRYAGRNSATRLLNLRIEYGQPISVRDHRRRHPWGTLPAAHGSAAHTHRPMTQTTSADTSADRRWLTPPSRCSANSPSAAISEIDTPSDLLQPSDLSPVLHDQHLLPPWLGSRLGHREGGGQLSVAGGFSRSLQDRRSIVDLLRSVGVVDGQEAEVGGGAGHVLHCSG